MGNKTREQKKNAKTAKIENEVLVKFRKKRELLGLSQDDVAKKLGVSQNTYKNIENGKQDLSFTRFLILTDILEIKDLSDIFGTSTIEIIEENQNLKPLKYLLENKAGFLEVAQTLDNISQSLKFALLPIQNNLIPENKENRIVQINLKATEVEKNMIKQHAETKGKSLIDNYLSLIAEDYLNNHK